MPIYRFFELYPDGRIRGIPIEVDCASDDDALARARILLSGSRADAMQVWLADRPIGRVNASDLGRPQVGT